MEEPGGLSRTLPARPGRAPRRRRPPREKPLAGPPRARSSPRNFPRASHGDGCGLPCPFFVVFFFFWGGVSVLAPRSFQPPPRINPTPGSFTSFLPGGGGGGEATHSSAGDAPPTPTGGVSARQLPRHFHGATAPTSGRRQLNRGAWAWGAVPPRSLCLSLGLGLSPPPPPHCPAASPPTPKEMPACRGWVAPRGGRGMTGHTRSGLKGWWMRCRGGCCKTKRGRGGGGYYPISSSGDFLPSSYLQKGLKAKSRGNDGVLPFPCPSAETRTEHAATERGKEPVSQSFIPEEVRE